MLGQDALCVSTPSCEPEHFPFCRIGGILISICVTFLWLLKQITTHFGASAAEIYPFMLLEAGSPKWVSLG